jgi:Salmonella virulence plasmid 65kDa B protein
MNNTQQTLALVVISAASLVAPTLSEAAVGRTPGNLSISQSGSATYSIPIWTPPGPRGMQPNMALVYNSNGGGGPVGKGWGLAGLSSISRCGKTFAQDANPAPVALAVSDGYCLNGNRLRLTAGTYGTAGSTYQTETADFSLITAVGAAGNGPASFSVKGKDGLIYDYGTAGNSRVLATGSATASLWMLNQIADRSGNKIVITYATPDAGLTGTTVPTQIEWTAVSQGASTYLYSMSFAYGDNLPAAVWRCHPQVLSGLQHFADDGELSTELCDRVQ